ncbi:Gp37-like protein [Mycolicibacterium sp. XJ1819]
MLTASEFAAIEQQLMERRYGYLTKKVPQPLIRLWDKEHKLIARITIPESWDCEEIAHDDGSAHIELVGKDNDWLREIICFKTRPAEDLHITIDPDPERPHDYKNRWGGKVETIEDDEVKGRPTVTKLNCVSNRRHFQHIYLAATPLLPHAVQPIKMFLWGGPCVTACATATMINLARIYTLNGWWPIPRNIFAPQTWLENLVPLNWPVQVMPVNPVFDQSRWVTFGARWKDAKTVLTPVMKDAGVILKAYTWLPGDPAPYTMFGPELAEVLKPTRACVILSFEDESGVGGPTGTAWDGLLNLFAATADDLITESLIAVDGDGDGETDPFIRKILGVAPKRPPFVYRDVGYGGAESRKMVIHKSKAITIITGGKSPQWVNQAITFAIRYGISQLAQVVLGVEAPGVEGLDNLYQGQLDDTLLAFMSFVDPRRSRDVGPYAFNEYFETGSGSAFTINSVQTIREGWWKTRPYTSFKFDVGDGSPFDFGREIRLGSRVSAERKGIFYTDQIMAYKRSGDRRKSGRPVLSFGDDSREEDPVARGFAAIGNVANFAALLAGSGDMF